MERSTLAAFFAIMVLSLACVVWAQPTLEGSQADKELLETIRKGTAQAADAMKSGKGRVTVYEWEKGKDGKITETVTDNIVTFEGQKTRVSRKMTYLQYAGQANIQPGTTLRTESYIDGTKTTAYNPEEKRAFVGEDPRREVGEAVRVAGSISVVGFGRYGMTYGIPERIKQYLVSDTMRVVGREVLNGQEHVIVERKIVLKPSDLKEPHTTISHYWVNPNRDYIVPRMRSWIEGALVEERIFVREMNTDYRKYGDVWGVAVSVDERFGPLQTGKTELAFREVTAFAPDFQVNVPVTEKELKLDLPEGTEIRNPSTP